MKRKKEETALNFLQSLLLEISFLLMVTKKYCVDSFDYFRLLVND